MDMPSDVLTLDEVATYLRISKSSLYKIVQRGEIPGQKIGKHWRFHRTSLEQWLKEGFKIEGHVEGKITVQTDHRANIGEVSS